MSDAIIQMKDVNKWFGDFQVLKNINLEVEANKKIVVCGPSGSGKSTLIRCINRMNDLIPNAKVTGNVLFEDQNIYDNNVDATEIRYKIGMVFQKPNPFPKSIYDNVAFGPRVNGLNVNLDDHLQSALQ